MADSTLDPTRATPAQTTKGHGTAALGPSGSSDSGSDLQGPGLAADAGLQFDTGTTSDLERSGGAGHDVGDANLDSDSDETGTGERSTAGRDDDVGEASDIAPDRIIGSELPMPADALDRIVVDDDAPDGASEEEQYREQESGQ
ncbi:MAG: hypothetical protein ACXW2G_06210 [Burkholderiaceae bacterium]